MTTVSRRPSARCVPASLLQLAEFNDDETQRPDKYEELEGRMPEGSPRQDASLDKTPTPEENAKRTTVLVFVKLNVHCL